MRLSMIIATTVLSACAEVGHQPEAPVTALAHAAAPPAPVFAEGDPLAEIQGQPRTGEPCPGTGLSKERRYVKAAAVTSMFPKGPELAELPANTEVDLLRRWTTDGTHTTCTLGVVRIVDTGGPLTWYTGKKYDVVGKLYLAKLADLMETRDGPSPADAEALRVAKARQDAATALAQEIKTGRCSDAHAAKVQQVALGLGDLFANGMTSGTDVYRVVGKQIIVATESGTPVTIDAGTGGEQHLFAVGFDSVHIGLKDGTGYAVPTSSPYAPMVQSTSGGRVDSRTFRAQVGERLAAKVTGSGCVLLLTVKRI